MKKLLLLSVMCENEAHPVSLADSIQIPRQAGLTWAQPWLPPPLRQETNLPLKETVKLKEFPTKWRKTGEVSHRFITQFL